MFAPIPNAATPIYHAPTLTAPWSCSCSVPCQGEAAWARENASQKSHLRASMLNAGVEMAMPKSTQTLGCSHPATAPANCNPPSSPPHCPGDPVVSAEHLGELQQASSTSKSGSSDQNQKRHHLPHLVCSPEALSESQPAVLGTELHPARLACACHDVMAIVLFSCLCFSPWSPLFFFSLFQALALSLPSYFMASLFPPPTVRAGPAAPTGSSACVMG